MTKEELKALVLEYGDAAIDFRGSESNKIKYNICTLDFSTPYIKSKQNRAKETDDTVLMFCWDTDSFRLIKPAYVVRVTPLATIISRSYDGST